MSAFLVQDVTINRVLTTLQTIETHLWPYPNCSAVDLETVGMLIREMNQNAIRERYGHADEAPDYVFSFVRTTRVQALKSLRCILYQCAEGRVPESELYRALDKVSHYWALCIINDLPEYDRARWDG